jgi:hypothetical protein
MGISFCDATLSVGRFARENVGQLAYQAHSQRQKLKAAAKGSQSTALYKVKQLWDQLTLLP